MTGSILRFLLLLAPRRFRSRYGAELLAVHRARKAERRSLGPRFVFALREIAGMGVTVIRARFSPQASPFPGAGHPGPGAIAERAAKDLRYGIRTLRRSPGFTAATITVLAIGIGANSAIFSAVNAFLFRPLPFGDSDRLMMLYETNPEFGWTHAQAAPANVLDWREQVDSFDDIALYGEFVQQTPFLRDGQPELLGFTVVTGNFFSVLGVSPALGRGFEWDETWVGRADVAVLSHAAWRTHFGSDPDISGKTVEIGGRSIQVVGVMPERFAYPGEETDVWVPWGWEPGYREQVWFRRAHFARPIARLAPGVTPERANAELQVVVERLKTDFPETNRVMGAGMMPIRDFLVMDVRGPLYVLLGAVALLLLLACMNAANLMLVRASDRSRDVALRVALGAGRGRVARQRLAEAGLLALAGGTVGLGLGWVGIRALSTKQPIGIEGATHMALDGRVILFTLAVSLASAILFGIAPALRTARGDVQEALKEGGRGRSTGPASLRTASTLVATQVALTLLLVVGAGLMVRTFLVLRDVNPGFRTDEVLAVSFTVPEARYPERDQVLSFQDEFQRLLEARPGIERVGYVGRLPLDGQSWSSQFQAEGWPPDRVGIEIRHRRADGGYFEALDIPLIRGRLFDPGEGPEDPLVVVINETFAEQHFPGEDPLGQRIAYDRAATEESIWYEIVGIVGDQHQVTPREEPVAEVFENRRQDWGRGDWFVIRTTGDATAAAGTVRNVLAELDPLIPVASMRPLREVWRSSMAREEFLLTLLAAFAISALLLATVGVYGVTAQAARKRTHEIGIRIALGARSAEVLGMILRQGLAVIGAGLAVGLLLALVATRAVAGFLHGVRPTDPVTLVTVVALLLLVAGAACLIPARRAASVDPAASLRAE